MGACPKCGAPAGDTDFACRQCGTSFVADPSIVAQNMAASAQQNQEQPPQGFGSQQGGGSFNPPSSFSSGNQSSYNPYSPPGAQPYGFSQAPGQPATTSSLASSAMTYAIIGFFCCGPIFGYLAMTKAQAARAQIAAQPGMPGMTTANNAYYLGVADILLWVVGFFLRFLLLGAQHHR